MTPSAFAQWTGSIGLVGVADSRDDSEQSFRSQYDLDDGVGLDFLELRHEGEQGSVLAITASGFGGVEPARRARLVYQPAAPWELTAEYGRRESFFRLAGFESPARRDNWEIERWRLDAEYRGWSAATLALELRYQTRDGFIDRPYYALNELYPLRGELDETLVEAGFSLESRSWPVTVFLEQSFARFKDQNRWQITDPQALGGDPDLFTEATWAREEETDIPTTRLVLTYPGTRFQFAGSLLYSPAELSVSGPVATAFGVAEGDAGRLEFLDDSAADSDRDVLSLGGRFGFALTDNLTLRLRADYRDASTDAALAGERLLRATNPLGGVFEFVQPVDERNVFDVTDESLRADIEWALGPARLWVGAFATAREVTTLPDSDAPATEVERDSDGFVLGASWRWGDWTGSAEYENGDFDDFVFRTDPEEIDRLTLRLRGRIAEGLSMGLRARLVDADNPPEISDLDQSTTAVGASVNWDHADGGSGLSLALDWLDVESETDLVLPDGRADVSIYDLDLVTATLQGYTALGKARLSGAVTRLDDSGATWPVESWNAELRVAYPVSERVEIGAFVEYWSYDEDLAEVDDFGVTRYGARLRWSFQ